MALLAFLFGASFCVMRRRIPYSPLLFLVSAISYPILLMSVHTETLFLSVPPLVYITLFLGLLNPPRTPLIVGADYSYGIYLYGFPLQQFVSYILPSHRVWLVNVVLGTALAFGCAYLLWTLVETRVLHKKAKILSFVSVVSKRFSERINEFFEPWPKLALVPVKFSITTRSLPDEPRQ